MKLSLRSISRTAGVFAAYCTVLVLARPSYGADKVVFEEALNDGNTNDEGYQGLIQTNVIVPGVTGGWQVSGQSSQIRYDIDKKGEYPNGLQCGTVEVDFRALDPIDNFHDLSQCEIDGGLAECYVNFVGVYDGIHGDFHQSQASDESFLLVHAMHEKTTSAAWRNSRLKFMAGSWTYKSPGIMNSYLPPMNQDDQNWAALTSSVYTASLTFDCAGVSYTLTRKDPGGATKSWSDNGPWSWNGDPGDHQPNYKYVFIGSDNANGFWIAGTIFQRVMVSEQTVCNCPAIDTSDAGTQEGGASTDAAAPDADDAGGVADSASVAPDATSGPAENGSAGCGCDAAGRRTNGALAACLGALLVLARRRRCGRSVSA